MNVLSNRRSSATRAWHIDHRCLLPGDVMLEAGDTLFGKTIRAVDRGQFSHALMWIGDSDFIEAVSSGARIISFARVLITDPEKWLWLRHPDEATARAAATEARNLAHKRYSLPKAFVTKLPGPPATSPTSLFCSQLVAEAYARAGAALVIGRSPGKVTPNDLVRTSALQSLGNPPLIAVDLAPEDLKLLDRDRSYRHSAPATEQRIAQEAFAAVKHLTRRLAPRPGNLAETLQALADADGDHSALADALLDELEQRSYFSLLDGLMFDLWQGVAANPPTEAVAGWRSSAQRHQEEWRTYSIIAKRSPYRIWRRFAQMYARNSQLFAGLIERAEAPSAGPVASD